MKTAGLETMISAQRGVFGSNRKCSLFKPSAISAHISLRNTEREVCDVLPELLTRCGGSGGAVFFVPHALYGTHVHY